MISLCHKHYAVWTSIMTLVLLSSVIPSSAGSVVAQENGSVTEPDLALTEMVFLPVVGASSDVVTALTTEDISHQEEWLPYEATYYSFSYPPDREVTEGFGGQYVALYPTEESSSGETLKIELAYLGYEITPEDDLLEWYNLYERLGGIEEVPEREILETRSEVQPDDTVTHRLHILNTSAHSRSQVILLTYGRLVLSFNAYIHDDRMTDVLRNLADSIVFHPDAPRTKAELYPDEEGLVTTLDEVIAIGQAPPPGPPAPDPPTLGQESVNSVSPSPTVTLSEEFLERERLYREFLEQENSDASNADPEDTDSVVAAGQVTANRQALPANFRSPIHTTWDVGCASALHTGRAAYAIDIQVPVNTPIASVQAGTIYYAGWMTGYGWIARIYSDVYTGGGWRRYYHNYAHLNAFVKTSGGVTAGEWIANSGASGEGATGPHLHFHMTRDVDFNDVDQRPVDLSPLRGFRPNMNYPVTGICGHTVSADLDPITIEPLMYTEAYQPRSDHYWNCSTYLPNNTTECYMAVVPLTGWGIDPLVSAQSPELRYANVYSFSTGTYYVWVCGYGGTLDDDSVWIGVNGSAASAVDATGHHLASWVWRSIRLSGQRPTVNLTFGNQVVNMWAREDGMRVDRILLTKNVNYNPTGNIRCGGY